MGIFDHDEVHQLRRIANELEELNCLVRQFLIHQVTGFRLFQIIGGKEMPISGIQAGSTGTFQIGFVPPNGVPLQSGPTVSSDDPLVTLGPVSTDGTFTFTASVDASDANTSFNITVAGVNGAGAALTHSFNVPIIAAPPPQITDFTLNQIS